jgi:hypothetical protein
MVDYMRNLLLFLSFLCFKAAFAMDPPNSDNQGFLIEALFSQQLPRNTFDALAEQDLVEVELVDLKNTKHKVVFYQKGYKEDYEAGNRELRRNFLKAGKAYSVHKQNLKFKAIKFKNRCIEIECEFASSNMCSWIHASTINFTVVTKDLYFNNFDIQKNDLNSTSLEQLPQDEDDIKLPVYNSLIPLILSRDAFDGFSDNDSVIIEISDKEPKRTVVFYQKGYIAGNEQNNSGLRSRFIKAGKTYSPYKQNLSLKNMRTNNGMLELDYEFIKSTYSSKIFETESIYFTVITPLDQDNIQIDNLNQINYNNLKPIFLEDTPALVYEDQTHGMEAVYRNLRRELDILNRMPKATTSHERILRDRHHVEFGQKVKQAEAELNKDSHVKFSFWYAYIYGELKLLPQQSAGSGSARGKKVKPEYIEELKRPALELHARYAPETPQEKAQRLALIEEQRKAGMRARRKEL